MLDSNFPGRLFGIRLELFDDGDMDARQRPHHTRIRRHVVKHMLFIATRQAKPITRKRELGYVRFLGSAKEET